jgi:hypothetical protein
LVAAAAAGKVYAFPVFCRTNQNSCCTPNLRELAIKQSTH